MTRSIQLIVQGDDFGMCHAVNAGTTRAFTDGIVTQASMMVPCPWFPAAAALALAHRIPVGIHSTLTCEWDGMRWGPLTSGRSLVGDDGTLHRTVADAAAADPNEATAELIAQTERFLAAGLELTYYDVHMGMAMPVAYEEATARYDVPFVYPGVARSLSFDSIKSLSDRAADNKTQWLLGYLERRTPGVHLLVTHCAADEPELHALAKPDSPVRPWAVDYRLSDLAAVTDREVIAAVDSLGIELVSISTATF